jgi:hypothetical protein
MRDCIFHRSPRSGPELAELAALRSGIRNPEALGLAGMVGLFCALIASPQLVLPSQ